MRAFKHTPGPWEVIYHNGPGIAYIHSLNDGELGVVYNAPIGSENGANAVLMSAAPDLLAALERVEKHFSIVAVGSIHDPNIESLREAVSFVIRKAKGAQLSSTPLGEILADTSPSGAV